MINYVIDGRDFKHPPEKPHYCGFKIPLRFRRESPRFSAVGLSTPRTLNKRTFVGFSVYQEGSKLVEGIFCKGNQSANLRFAASFRSHGGSEVIE